MIHNPEFNHHEFTTSPLVKAKMAEALYGKSTPFKEVFGLYRAELEILLLDKDYYNRESAQSETEFQNRLILLSQELSPALRVTGKLSKNRRQAEKLLLALLQQNGVPVFNQNRVAALEEQEANVQLYKREQLQIKREKEPYLVRVIKKVFQEFQHRLPEGITFASPEIVAVTNELIQDSGILEFDVIGEAVENLQEDARQVFEMTFKAIDYTRWKLEKDKIALKTEAEILEHFNRAVYGGQPIINRENLVEQLYKIATAKTLPPPRRMGRLPKLALGAAAVLLVAAACSTAPAPETTAQAATAVPPAGEVADQDIEPVPPEEVIPAHTYISVETQRLLNEKNITLGKVELTNTESYDKESVNALLQFLLNNNYIAENGTFSFQLLASQDGQTLAKVSTFDLSQNNDYILTVYMASLDKNDPTDPVTLTVGETGANNIDVGTDGMPLRVKAFGIVPGETEERLLTPNEIALYYTNVSSGIQITHSEKLERVDPDIDYRWQPIPAGNATPETAPTVTAEVEETGGGEQETAEAIPMPGSLAEAPQFSELPGHEAAATFIQEYYQGFDIVNNLTAVAFVNKEGNQQVLYGVDNLLYASFQVDTQETSVISGLVNFQGTGSSLVIESFHAGGHETETKTPIALDFPGVEIPEGTNLNGISSNYLSNRNPEILEQQLQNYYLAILALFSTNGTIGGKNMDMLKDLSPNARQAIYRELMGNILAEIQAGTYDHKGITFTPGEPIIFRLEFGRSENKLVVRMIDGGVEMTHTTISNGGHRIHSTYSGGFLLSTLARTFSGFDALILNKDAMGNGGGGVTNGLNVSTEILIGAILPDLTLDQIITLFNAIQKSDPNSQMVKLQRIATYPDDNIPTDLSPIAIP